MKNAVTLFLLTLVLLACKQNENLKVENIPERKQPKTISYAIENSKIWLTENQKDKSKMAIVLALSRTDNANISKIDSLVIPSDFTGDLVYYLPFPLEVPYIKEVSKVLYFSYPTQTFGAYENGNLVYTGPTNMGRKKDQTPTGLFFTNWKAEQTTSTFNDEWDLKWNFNIENKLGVGFHEYALPGYPASHSCLRLQEKDAKFLYEWANQWELSDPETVKVKGTPVIVFGKYNFDEPKPWLQLPKNSKILNISQAEIQEVTASFLNTIMLEQSKRKTFENSKSE